LLAPAGQPEMPSKTYANYSDGRGFRARLPAGDITGIDVETLAGVFIPSAAAQGVCLRLHTDALARSF
jgi:hypothetical protein